jgi:rubredoxin
MNQYRNEKRNFEEIDNRVDIFNKKYKNSPYVNQMHARIDLDYVSNSDEIENIKAEHTIPDILNSKTLKILRSYPMFFPNYKNLKSGKISDKIFNVNDADYMDTYEKWIESLKNTGLCIYDTETGEEKRDVAAGTEWDDVPADFKCPLCGAVKTMFKAL